MRRVSENRRKIWEHTGNTITCVEAKLQLSVTHSLSYPIQSLIKWHEIASISSINYYLKYIDERNMKPLVFTLASSLTYITAILP